MIKQCHRYDLFRQVGMQIRSPFKKLSSINCLSGLYYSEVQYLSLEASCHTGLLARREGRRLAPKCQAEKQPESDQSSSWWSGLVAAGVTLLRTPSLTHVVGPGAVGRQAGSRNECDGSGATLERGGVCGELACASPQPAVAQCGPSVSGSAHTFGRNKIY